MELAACDMRDFAWFHQRTGFTAAADARGIKALDRHGRTHGMVVFDRWTETAAQAHVCLETMASARPLLLSAFRYAFGPGGRSLLLGTVAGQNRRSIRLAHRLGFREIYRIRDGFAKDNPLVLFEMRRENCRWLEPARKVA